MISQDELGVFKLLQDGQVLRIQERMYNTMLTLSSSREDQSWRDGW
jgi:hypothetical protein